MKIPTRDEVYSRYYTNREAIVDEVVNMVLSFVISVLQDDKLINKHKRDSNIRCQFSIKPSKEVNGTLNEIQGRILRSFKESGWNTDLNIQYSHQNPTILQLDIDVTLRGFFK